MVSKVTWRQLLATILLLVWAYTAFHGYYYWPHVDSVTLAAEYDASGSYWKAQYGAPQFSAHLAFTFTAVGSVSVNNRVNVTVTVSRVSLSNTSASNFLQFYNGVAFTYGFDPNTIHDNPPGLATVYLRDGGNGTYTGAGQLVWLQEGPTNVFLTPNTPMKWYLSYSTLSAYPSVIIVAPEADTLSIQSNLATQRLTWILIAFSFLMLQPVLDAYFRLGQE